MRYLIILIFCSLIFWNCSHDNMPFIAEESYVDPLPSDENGGYVSLGLNQSTYFPGYAVKLKFINITHMDPYAAPAAVLEVRNPSGALSSIYMRLDEEEVIGSYYGEDYYHYSLHIKISGIDVSNNWVTIYYWETRTGYGNL